MNDFGIRHAARPQDGRIEVTYSAADEDRAAMFLSEYVMTDASEYQEAKLAGKPFRSGVPEAVFDTAVVFTKAANTLHLHPGIVQWLMAGSTYFAEEDFRDFAVHHLGLERVEDPVEAAKNRMAGRRAATGQLGKENQLEQAIAGASPQQIATAIPGYLDGDEIMDLIELLSRTVNEDGASEADPQCLWKNLRLAVKAMSASHDQHDVAQAIHECLSLEDLEELIGSLEGWYECAADADAPAAT